VTCIVAAPWDLDVGTESTLQEGGVAMYAVDLHLRAGGEQNLNYDKGLCRHVAAQWVASKSLPPTYLKVDGVPEWQRALESASAEAAAGAGDAEDGTLEPA
jgi:hypothetical protein